jgi:hypothetical protein
MTISFSIVWGDDEIRQGDFWKNVTEPNPIFVSDNFVSGGVTILDNDLNEMNTKAKVEIGFNTERMIIQVRNSKGKLLFSRNWMDLDGIDLNDIKSVKYENIAKFYSTSELVKKGDNYYICLNRSGDEMDFSGTIGYIIVNKQLRKIFEFQCKVMSIFLKGGNMDKYMFSDLN